MWEHDVAPTDAAPIPDFVMESPAVTPQQNGPAEPAWTWLMTPEDVWPPAPETVEQTGLPISLLYELVLKIIHFSGPSSTETISQRIGLPFMLVEGLLQDLKGQQLLEVVGASRLNELGFRYRLTARGEQRAQDALARSRYASAAPVTLEQYTAVVRRQSLRQTPPSPTRILQALNELVLSPETVDNLARALHSGRTTLIFGASGNGKTAILEHYARYTNDTILVPHALYVHGQLIRIFDVAVHQPVTPEAEPADAFGLFKPQSRINHLDRRWIQVRRPVVIVGGELTQESLELSFDPVAHFYQAPPHLKAQDGMFVIDDFGRQRVRPEELLNRWILPMERGFDLLTLHTGESFMVPFEMALMFSTNLRPDDLVDEAFLRRIPYKVHIPGPTREELCEITRRVAAAKRLACTEEQIAAFVDMICADPQREPKGVYPRDLIQIIFDVARFEGSEPALTPEMIQRAMRVYFMDH